MKLETKVPPQVEALHNLRREPHVCVWRLTEPQGVQD